VLLLIVLLLFVIVALLLRLLAAVRGGAGGTSGTTSQPPPAIPDTVGASAVAGFLAPRLAGAPADGSSPAAGAPSAVVWVDRGDEVLVHLDSTATQIVGQTLLVSIDLETDQTGRTPLVVAFALGTSAEGTLVAATDAYPRGNALLASRWGAAVRSAAWSAMLALANDHAAERGLAPRGLAIAGGNLTLVAGAAPTIA